MSELNISFYNGTAAASAQQTRLDIISNNMANIQTEGYRAQNAGFLDLLYSNMDAEPPTGGDLTVGSSVRVEKTDINFTEGPLMETGGNFDYAIVGDGYFALYDMAKDEIRYTRSGNFFMSNTAEQADAFYLCAKDGSFVLDPDSNLIPVEASTDDPAIGVFDFPNKEGILLQGNSQFLPVPKNGEPIVKTDAKLQRRYLEGSNVDLSYEMSKVIESQRAYQLSLRMVSTSDEVEQTINSLR